jgi:hypothetical protein
MKLTKAEKKELKYWMKSFIELGGFINIFDNGITKVYSPDGYSEKPRMYQYGLSVCNASDKYNRKRGIYYALKDFQNNYKLIPVELIKAEFRSEFALEYIG